MSYVGNTNTTQGFTPAVDYFSGNGSTVAFTLSRPVASTAQVQVVVNNVAQNPTDAFTVLNNTITFTSAPSIGTNNIYVQYTSPITQVIQPGQGTVGTAQIQSGAVIPADLSTGAPVWDVSGNLSGIANLTTTGNTVLGNASTDTLNVGNGGFVKDASGRILMPFQTAFMAAGSGTQSWSGAQAYQIVSFANIYALGSRVTAFSSSTFTAPVAGAYMFLTKITPISGTTGPQANLFINGVFASFPEMSIAYGSAYASSTGFGIIQLAANDAVTLRVANNNAVSFTLDLGRCSFAGFLIG